MTAHTVSPAPGVARVPRNKSLAAWLALLGGSLGLQRFYLRGSGDLIGWAWWLPTLLGAYGLWRARALGLDDQLSWALSPWLGVSVSAGALHAILIGLTARESWNQRMQPERPQSDPAGATTWATVLALVLAGLAGATALIATIAFTAQRAFEFAAA